MSMFRMLTVPEVLAGIKLYKSWTSISRMFPMARRQTTIYMFTRVVVFNVYSIITLRCVARTCLKGVSLMVDSARRLSSWQMRSRRGRISCKQDVSEKQPQRVTVV